MRSIASLGRGVPKRGRWGRGEDVARRQHRWPTLVSTSRDRIIIAYLVLLV
jgi:hypothetical protein